MTHSLEMQTFTSELDLKLANKTFATHFVETAIKVGEGLDPFLT